MTDNKKGDLNSKTSLRQINIKEIFHIDSFPINGEDPIKYDERINERNDVFDVIIKDKTNYNIVAAMGGGKTTGLIRYLSDNKIKAVVVFPLKSNVLQVAAHFESEYGITLGPFHGDIKNKTIFDYLHSKPPRDILICVYDSLPRLFSIPGFDAADYILVIDELHNLSTQYSFRNKAIKNISLTQDRFKKVISLTGTPEGTLYNGARNIVFTKKNPPKSITNMKIVLSPKKDNMITLANNIIKLKRNGKIVVFINNKLQINALQKQLTKRAKEINSHKFYKVESLYIPGKGQNKSFNKKLFDHLVKTNFIPDEVEYFITTSIISDGINILNDNIDRIIIFDIKDWWVKRQFISRFRKGVKEVLDMTYGSHKSTCCWFDIKSEFESRLSKFTDHKQNFEKLKEERIAFGKKLGLEDIPMMPLPIDNDFIYFDNNKKQFEVSKERIALSIIDDINYIMWKDTEKSIEFCKEIAKYKVAAVSLSKLVDNKDADKPTTKLSIKEKEYFLKELKTFFKIYVDLYHKNNPKCRYIHEDFFPIMDFDSDGFYKRYFKIFENEAAKNVLKEIFSHSILHYPFDLSHRYASLRINNETTPADKMIKEFEAYFRMLAKNYIVNSKKISTNTKQFTLNNPKYKLIDMIEKYYDVKGNYINYNKLREHCKKEKIVKTSHDLLSALHAIYELKTKSDGKFKNRRAPNEIRDLDSLLERHGLDPYDLAYKIDDTSSFYMILHNDIETWLQKPEKLPEEIFVGLKLLEREVIKLKETFILKNA